jgi:hypothetical protein
MDPRGYDLVYLARLEERMKGRGFVPLRTLMSQKMFHLSVTTNIPPVVHNGEDIRDLKLSFHKNREDGPIN